MLNKLQQSDRCLPPPVLLLFFTKFGENLILLQNPATGAPTKNLFLSFEQMKSRPGGLHLMMQESNTARSFMMSSTDCAVVFFTSHFKLTRLHQSDDSVFAFQPPNLEVLYSFPPPVETEIGWNIWEKICLVMLKLTL